MEQGYKFIIVVVSEEVRQGLQNDWIVHFEEAWRNILSGSSNTVIQGLSAPSLPHGASLSQEIQAPMEAGAAAIGAQLVQEPTPPATPLLPDVNEGVSEAVAPPPPVSAQPTHWAPFLPGPPSMPRRWDGGHCVNCGNFHPWVPAEARVDFGSAAELSEPPKTAPCDVAPRHRYRRDGNGNLRAFPCPACHYPSWQHAIDDVPLFSALRWYWPIGLSLALETTLELDSRQCIVDDSVGAVWCCLVPSTLLLDDQSCKWQTVHLMWCNGNFVCALQLHYLAVGLFCPACHHKF